RNTQSSLTPSISNITSRTLSRVMENWWDEFSFGSPVSDDIAMLGTQFGNTSYTSDEPDSPSAGSTGSDCENLDFSKNCSNRLKTHQKYKQNKNPLKRVIQRQAANCRERKRMKTLNDGFEKLRDHIPEASMDKKLSKVDTLRLAIQYIDQLQSMITVFDDSSEGGMKDTSSENKKVIIRCHATNTDGYHSHDSPLYGHSLSWSNITTHTPDENNRLKAKLWTPECSVPETYQIQECNFRDLL
ncbi:unnamed protein product, partial [Owenia fusiformis]